MDRDHWTNQSEDLTGNMQIITLPRQHTSNNLVVSLSPILPPTSSSPSFIWTASKLDTDVDHGDHDGDGGVAGEYESGRGGGKSEWVGSR